MNQLFKIFFQPPPMPDINYPIPARLLPGFKRTIEEIYAKVFFTGVYEGIALGVLLTLMFVPSIKQGIFKGIGDAIHKDHP